VSALLGTLLFLPPDVCQLSSLPSNLPVCLHKQSREQMHARSEGTSRKKQKEQNTVTTMACSLHEREGEEDDESAGRGTKKS